MKAFVFTLSLGMVGPRMRNSYAESHEPDAQSSVVTATALSPRENHCHRLCAQANHSDERPGSELFA